MAIRWGSAARGVAWAGLVLAVLVPAGGDAVELFEGRLQLHGFYETQIRGIARDFDASDDWDLTQWAHILNLEIEADIAPDGFGPFDIVTGFARVEVRYDCVWTRACGLFPSVNAFSDGAKRLPKRYFDGRRAGFVMNVPNGDTRYIRGENPEFSRTIYKNMPRDSRRPFGIESTDAFGTLFTSPGIDGELFTEDDPSPFFFDRYFTADSRRCKFSSRAVRGPENGVGQLNLGPFDPACDVEPIAAFADKPNPFRARDRNPLFGTGGFGALPYRPAPEVGYDSNHPDSVPRGLWIPNARLAEMLENDELEDPPINFSQDELAWNHGASQHDEKELKELYVDLEMFDSRLWLRLGKQTIVWGKTELFRNQDQFNPQDLALSSLPSLEESRTALWAARATWSFYEVGPLSDVRLEVAVNYDEFEANDLGDCGEPYAVILVCAGTFGFLAHGFEGLGIAGIQNPPAPWNSWSGVEAGARLEFRWDRFSFAISDFYGYDDLPTIERIFRFSRNVDPLTGRPRRLDSEGSCRTGREEACLRPDTDALLNHSGNQTLFAKNCAATFGFIDLDPTACGLSIFNSRVITDPTNPQAPLLNMALTNVMSGQGFSPAFFFSHGAAVFEGLAGMTQQTLRELERFPHIRAYNPVPDSLSAGQFSVFCATTFPRLRGAGGLPGCPTPLVPLSLDPNDGPQAVPSGLDRAGLFASTGLQPFLTDEQEALLGCGAFYGTSCDLDGIDLFNAEASALIQSFVGFEGTFGDWSTTDGRRQPGTVGFEGGPVCTRFERGRTFILPGCRGPGDPGYDPRVDGTTTGPARNDIVFPTVGRRRHPFTGQYFRSEMAVFSWNLMMTLVGFSMPDDPASPKDDEFDANRPFRTDACSFAKPQLCENYANFLDSLSTQRNDVRAGGTYRFGRRDFIWHAGNPIYIRFEKRNVMGFSTDFAEDVTKSNWGIELTWVDDVPYGDADRFDGLAEVDTYNLTVSVDRPTFVNFLNANRTFFMNSQIFVQYVDGYRSSFSSNGPWNLLATLTITTGYFQDRLLPSVTGVWDVRSDSGAFLSEVAYRFTENFSASVGAVLFAGRFQEKTMSINPIASRNRTGEGAYKDVVENGLSVLRDRDELFLKLRYTF